MIDENAVEVTGKGLSVYLQKVRNLNRDAVYLVLALGIYSATAVSGMEAVLFNLYLLRMGYGTPFIGAIISAGHVIHAVFSFIAGSTFRRVSIKTKMLVGLSVFIGLRFLLPAADILPADVRSIWIIVTYTFSMCGAALFFVCSKPYLMFAANSEVRNHAFSLQGAMQPLAGFLGAFLGGFFPSLFAAVLRLPMSQAAPYRFSLLLTPMFMLGALHLVRRLTPDTTIHYENRVLQNGDRCPTSLIAAFALIILLTGAGSGTMRAFFNVYLDQYFKMPTYRIGIITAIGQSMAIPAALIAPVFISWMGKKRGLAVGSAGIAAGLAMTAFIPHWLGAGAGYAMTFISIAIYGVMYNVLQLEMVPAYWRSTMAGTTLLAKGLGWAAISLLGGIIIARFGYALYFSIGVVLPLLGLLLLIAAFRHTITQ